ncbi:MAG: PriCT-2 domain-containing protein [Candidatus Thiodiazotropha sp. (ex Monitilora ramsayi)]|nr:PriCT-2 domain-containing protein [Candidatus Thiodiazotropha sp. (ex Monitilora ramsayi)]
MQEREQLTLDDVEGALSVVDYDDREIWIQMGMAIKDEFGEDGFSVWDDWSSRSDKYNMKDARSVWKSFNKSGFGIGSLINEARNAGYEFKFGELSKEERLARKKEAEARRKARAEAIERDERELAAWHERVALAAQRLLDERILDDSGVSQYLQTKKVMAYGIYFTPRAFLWITDIQNEQIDLVTDRGEISDFFDRKKNDQIDIEQISFRYIKRDTIAIPMRDLDGNLHNFQFIFSSGKKTFPKFGRKQGLFHICEPPDGTPSEQRPSTDGPLIASDPSRIQFAEGYATSSSILQATKRPVVVTFDSGNMPTVAAAFRGVYPDSELIFCGDDDQENKKNAGRKKAEEAAKITQGVAVFPDFSGIAEGAAV